MIIQVSTPSRLHFGLLSLPAGELPLSNEGGESVAATRWFGGAGLMIETPGIQLTSSESSEWSATGPLARRAWTLPIGSSPPFLLAGSARSSYTSTMRPRSMWGLARALSSAWLSPGPLPSCPD